MEGPYEFSSKFRKVTTSGDGVQQAKRRLENRVVVKEEANSSGEAPAFLSEMHNLDYEFVGVNKGVKKMKVERSPVGAPSPPGSDSGIEEDQNLSWLLNYKINELPPVPDSCNEVRKVEAVFFDATPSTGMIDVLPPQNHPEPPAPRQCGPKKPPFTYTELIEHALGEKGELTVSGIYQWISDHFPFYKQNDDRWKNSVRHNLSINPHFRKGSKAVHGAGHLWTIAQREDQGSWKIRRQKIQDFIQTTMSEYSKQRMQEVELQNATASILPHENDYNVHIDDVINTSKDLRKYLPQNVQVEYIIEMSGGMGDFLSPPVSKEQVVQECGLSNDYLITDLNPAALGLNLGEAEININSSMGSNIYDYDNYCFELQTE